jgi:hypothetical protein
MQKYGILDNDRVKEYAEYHLVMNGYHRNVLGFVFYANNAFYRL